MSVNDAFIKTPDGLQLFMKLWRPEETPVANLVLIHGYAEHSGRYQEFAEWMNQRRIAVSAFDLRGHGRSSGRRAYIHSFENYLSDLTLFLERIAEIKESSPCFLFGQSMGGAIAANYVCFRSQRFNGLLLSAPALKPPDDVTSFKLIAARALTLFFPTMSVAPPIPADRLSRRVEAVQAYANDPLVYRGHWQSRTAVELIAAMIRARNAAAKLTLPLLLLHGNSDRVVPHSASGEFQERAGSKDKTFELYEGFYHELLHEPERETVFQDIYDWIQERLG